MSYLNRAAKGMSQKETKQTEPLPGRPDVKRNNAGGFGWEVTDEQRVLRFLVLGAEGGTYYQKEQALAKENAEAAMRMLIGGKGDVLVKLVTEVSEAGRAPKNDPALFLLALALTHGDGATKRAAGEAIPRVARIGTHLFHLVGYLDQMRGWGRGLRRAVGAWYLQRTPDQLALEAVKYKARDGWGHRDVLRVAHPRGASPEQSAVLRFMVGADGSEREVKRGEKVTTYPATFALPNLLVAVDEVWKLWAEGNKQGAWNMMREYRVPREALPTEMLSEAGTWTVLLEAGMPIGALIRNLGNLGKHGLLDPFGYGQKKVVEKLTNAEELKRGRIHPIGVLAALMTYQNGQGARGSGQWRVNERVVEALNEAFRLSFGNVIPAGTNHLIGLDISGSMFSGEVCGVPGLTPAVAAAAMAKQIVDTEPETHVMAFQQRFVPFPITKGMELGAVLKQMHRASRDMGGTDCSLPMRYATQARMNVETFVVITDSETWAGSVYPSQALVQFRQVMGIPARLAVVGMTSSGFSIADPKDGGMLDCVGFDTATPQIVADFAGGRLG